MKFTITRTSDWYNEHVLDESSKFFGRLHTTQDGRYYHNKIELDTLGELIELVKEQDEVVISCNSRRPSIEIYDTYRE